MDYEWEILRKDVPLRQFGRETVTVVMSVLQPGVQRSSGFVVRLLSSTDLFPLLGGVLCLPTMDPP